MLTLLLETTQSENRELDRKLGIHMLLLKERHALHARDLKPLPAADILANHHVVAPQHIGLCLGEFRAVTIICPWRQTLLLGSHQPLNFIFRRLMTVRTAQVRRFLIRPLVEKFALIHEEQVSGVRLWVSGSDPGIPDHNCTSDYCTFRQHSAHSRQRAPLEIRGLAPRLPLSIQ